MDCVGCTMDPYTGNWFCPQEMGGTCSESDKTDNINKPSHYQGKYGLESIRVIDNFIWDLEGKAAWSWGNAIKYLLRFQKKNGLEDVKKAIKNLEWLVEEMEKNEQLQS